MFKRRKPRNFWQNFREWIWPTPGWARATQYIVQRLVRLNDGPRTIAIGMACGAFISASPFVGTHFLQAAVLALLLRGNIIAATLGTWVGNPFSFPLIWISTYQAGYYLIGGTAAEKIDIDLSRILQAPYETLLPLLKPMLIGSIPVGFALGLVTYFLTLWIVKAYKLAIQKRRAKKKQQMKTGD